MEVEWEPPSPGTRTLRSCFLSATWSLISWMSVVVCHLQRCFGALRLPERLGARTPFSQHHPAEDPPGRRGAAQASYPAASSSDRAHPATLASAASVPAVPAAANSTRSSGAEARGRSSLHRSYSALPPSPPHFLIRGQSQPCGRALIPPPHGARAIRRAALPSWYLHPLLAPDALSPAPAALTLKEKRTLGPSSCL